MSDGRACFCSHDWPHDAEHPCGGFTGIGPCPCTEFIADNLYPPCECGHDEGVHSPDGGSCGDCDQCHDYLPNVVTLS